MVVIGIGAGAPGRGRRRRTAVLAVAGVVAALASTSSAEARPAAGAAAPTPARAAATTGVTFTEAWDEPVTGSAISTSSPVLVTNKGKPFVATGDDGGNIRAFDLGTGHPVGGWANVFAGYGIRAPLSSDGASVYVPVAQDGPFNVPQYKKFDAKGRLQWNTNPRISYPGPGQGILLAGMSLVSSGGWKAIGPSSGQHVYGFNAGNGARLWSFLNADSTMATAAIADVRGTGSPQVITSNDLSEQGSGRRTVGLMRILTLGGKQLCSARQMASGTAYRDEGYNNSSPAVMEVRGKPLIVLGSTGPTQYGAGDNQVLGYDANCRLRWASAPLAGRVQSAPALADVLGRGTPQIVQMIGISDGGQMYPRIYVIDPATGRTLADTGSTFRVNKAQIIYPPGTSVVTADVDGDGAQDMFVPANHLLVISGRTRKVLTEIRLKGPIQNTPIITALPGHGIRVTAAGYNGAGSWIASYTSDQGRIGTNAWTQFANSPRLTGVQGTVNG